MCLTAPGRFNTSCTNPDPCPINCTGSWSDWSTCTADCAGGNQTSVFTITTPAQHGGLLCEAENSTERNQTCNTHPCPVDCLGEWGNWTECSAACGTGRQSSVFHMERDSRYGGVDCPAADNEVREQTCNEQPCPVPCVGGFVDNGPCLATCSSTGLQHEVFLVTTEAQHGGKPCLFANSSARFTACTNSTVCPWADVAVPDSPPVLPPLNITLNSTGVVIKGGNVTISGIRIEGLTSGVTNGSTGSATSGSFSVGSSSGGSNATAAGSNATDSSGRPLKPRLAAFNGTLGFYTLGLLVEVLGEFELQCSMEWTWDTTWSAWTTQVIFFGRLLTDAGLVGSSLSC